MNKKLSRVGIKYFLIIIKYVEKSNLNFEISYFISFSWKSLVLQKLSWSISIHTWSDFVRLQRLKNLDSKYSWFL